MSGAGEAADDKGWLISAQTDGAADRRRERSAGGREGRDVGTPTGAVFRDTRLSAFRVERTPLHEGLRRTAERASSERLTG